MATILSIIVGIDLCVVEEAKAFAQLVLNASATWRSIIVV